MKVAIAGYGLAGRVFHGPLIEAVEGLEVAAVVTTDRGRAEQASRAHPAARVVGSIDEAWDVDVLVVATSNRSHADLTLAAVERGVAVVVDKPLATNAADGERILAAGGDVTVFQNRRWDGDFLTVCRLLDQFALGDVVRFESRFERFRPSVDDARWREQGDPAEGGGQLLDLGAHLVDQAIVLFGPPLSVYAEVDRRRPGAAVDDDVFIALEHEDGVRAHLSMGVVAPLAGPRMRVSGMAGGLAVDGLDPQEAQLAAGLRPGSAGYGERPPGRLVDPDGGVRELPLDAGRYHAFYEGVRDWLTAGAPPPVDPLDSLTGLRVLEAARRSAETHTVIDLQETDV